LFGLFFACVLGEIALRVTDYEGLSLMYKDAALGQKYKPGAHAIVYSDESRKKVDIRINSLGFRDAEHSFGKSAQKRVLILGDSFVAAFSVEQQDAFPALLQKLSSWEVINFGVAGFGTAQELLSYEEYGRKFHPDFVVLCFFSGNDVSDNSAELSSNPRVYFHLDLNGNLVKDPPNQFRSVLSAFLSEHSRFYLWQKTQMRKLEQFYKSNVNLNPAHRVFLANYDDKMTRAWNITFALTRKLNLETKSDGSQLVVLYLPFSDEVNPDWWKENVDSSPPMRGQKWDLEKPVRLLESFCSTEGIRFISPKNDFLKETNHRFYFKHGHLNEEGHKKIAEILDRYLKW
jgi:hypothetical protein